MYVCMYVCMYVLQDLTYAAHGQRNARATVSVAVYSQPPPFSSMLTHYVKIHFKVCDKYCIASDIFTTIIEFAKYAYLNVFAVQSDRSQALPQSHQLLPMDIAIRRSPIQYPSRLIHNLSS